MGVFLKNKSSSINTIVSTGIVQFILMLIFGVLLLSPYVIKHFQGVNAYIIEFDATAHTNDIVDVTNTLTMSSKVDTKTVDHITSQEALQLMSSDIATEMLDRVKEDNPFRDIVQFVLKEEVESGIEEFINDIRSMSGVSGVYSSNVSETSTSPLGHLAVIPGILFIILVGILAFVLLQSLVEGLLSRNNAMISSLAKYGAESGFLKSGISNMAIGQVIRGWIVALVLFIVVVYLFLANLDLGFSDISLAQLLLVIFLPLILTIMFLVSIINFKLSNRLKTLL